MRSITDVADVIKLAGRGGAFDLEDEFGVSSETCSCARPRHPTGDRRRHRRLARCRYSAGHALQDHDQRYTTAGTLGFAGRDARRYRRNFRFGLSRATTPSPMRSCRVIIQTTLAARSWPCWRECALARRDEWPLNRRTIWFWTRCSADQVRIDELRAAIEKEPYVFDRRFLLRVLSMGHSQFAELIGARGPNTQINAACATTTQAVSLAADWIRAGRCRRVIVISADDVTSDNMIEWFGAGFLASGAAATDEVVEDAAIPFDRRRHGLIIGMGAAALVVESAAAARERGIQPICEVLCTVTANSAFHGTRLDVQHIGQVMEKLVAKAEAGSGISRQQVAPQMVFVSHETYTPARGGSASAEIHALRHVFGDLADQHRDRQHQGAHRPRHGYRH